MFNVGGGEVFVILLVALIVLGPDKLPGAVRKVGQVVSEFRKVSAGFQAEMRTAMLDEDASRRIGARDDERRDDERTIGPGRTFDPPLPPDAPRSPLDMDRPE
jgi:Tat protein translocase TatB subunit